VRGKMCKNGRAREEVKREPKGRRRYRVNVRGGVMEGKRKDPLFSIEGDGSRGEVYNEGRWGQEEAKKDWVRGSSWGLGK